MRVGCIVRGEGGLEGHLERDALSMGCVCSAQVSLGIGIVVLMAVVNEYKSDS